MSNGFLPKVASRCCREQMWVGCLAVALGLVAACNSSQLPRASLVIRGVNIVDVIEGSIHADRTVLIDGNRIVAIVGASVMPEDVPVSGGAEVEVIEAGGEFLMPGLWDMHTHSAHEADWHFPLFLAHGVTGIRNISTAGDEELTLVSEIKRRLTEGALAGPRFLAGGPSLDGEPQLATQPMVIRDAAEAREAVERLAAAGADFLKVYETLTRDAYFAIMDQARRRGIPVDGHVPFRILPEEAAAAGQRTVEHLLGLAWGCDPDAAAKREEYEEVLSRYDQLTDLEAAVAEIQREHSLYMARDVEACASVIDAYRQHDVAATPTLVAFQNIVNPEEAFTDPASRLAVPESVQREWESMLDTDLGAQLRSYMRPQIPIQQDNARLLNDSGVVVLAGTDLGVPMLAPGLSLVQELELLAEAGLTPLEALRTATLNPARVLGLDDLGSVEPGKIADLVLLEANPLDDIANVRRIRAVITDGRLYEREALDQMAVDAVSDGR